jgi:type IV secretory pathway VirD2 relaxase
MKSSEELPIFRPRLGGKSRVEKAPVMKRSFLDQLSKKTASKKTATRSLRGGHRNRGAGPSHVKSAGHYARRVVVKARIVQMTAAGKRAAMLHVQYVERGGVEKDGTAGKLYGDENRFDRNSFQREIESEPHQFRFIVSPENADDLDLNKFTRKLVNQMESDLDRKIDWGAVNHYNTDNPHVHIIVRGVDSEGNELRISPDYISNGIRNRAGEIATRELGMRSELEIRQQRTKEVSPARLTSLDRSIAAIERNGMVELGQCPVEKGELFQQRLLSRRLKSLESFGLAENTGVRQWSMTEGWEQKLQAIARRNEIFREMRQSVGGDPGKYRMYDPQPDAQRIEGKLVSKGVSDEWHDRYYIVVETPQGNAWYVNLGKSSDPGKYGVGDIVSVSAEKEEWLKKADLAIASHTAKHGGIYERQQHLKEIQEEMVEVEGGGRLHRKAYVEALERRLQRLQRFGLVRQLPDGSWRVPDDLTATLKERNAANPALQQKIDRQSLLRLPEQENYRGRMWIDRFTAKSDNPEFAKQGFGKELNEAVRRRALFLQELGIDPLDPARAIHLDKMEKHDLAEKIKQQQGGEFRELKSGDRFRGTLTDTGLQASGKRYAQLFDPKSKEFSLVPWKQDYERLVSKQVELIHAEVGYKVVQQLDLRKGR